MQVIKEWQLKQLREEYPVGTRVELIYMNDPYNRKLGPGCQGTVHVSWDCGSSLGLIPGEDSFHIITEKRREERCEMKYTVKVKEINPSTMESKFIQNLYFTGEVLDLDALTGGFNLQIAWATAYAAGLSV